MKVLPYQPIVAIMLASTLLSGCASTGSWKWPFGGSKSSLSDNTNPTDAYGGSIAQNASGIRGQFNSMSTAVSSAYGKAKTAMASALMIPPANENMTNPGDPTSLSTKVASVSPEVYVAQGQVYESMGKFPQATDMYSKALSIEPKNAAALASIARLHGRQGDNTKAVEFFQRAIQATPDDPQLYNDLGMCYSQQGQYASAKEQLQKAIAIRPAEASYHNNLAEVMVDNGQADQAMTELQKVHQPAMANYQLALIYAKRNNLPTAQQHLVSAVQIDPNLKPARDMLDRMGGPQMAQQAMGTIQTAGNVLNTARGLIGPAAGASGSTVTPLSTSTPGISSLPPVQQGSLSSLPTTPATTSTLQR